jgi:hypothetical protein
MNATSQHGFHPDAESLSAFSEQALEGRERDEVLAHLAVCGRCREVVALASEAAATGEVTAAAPPRKTIAPNAWWKQWRLVWVPTAVVAAFAMVSISVYIERADRHAANIRIAEQNPTPDATPPATSAPSEQAKVESPAATAPAPPPAHPAKHAHPAAPEQLPAPAPPVVAAQMPSPPEAHEPQAPAPRIVDQVEAYREAAPRSHAEAMQAPPEATAGGMRPAESQPAESTGEAKKNQPEQQQQAEQQRQAETETSRMRSFKAKAAPFATHGANTAPPASATESVTVAAAPQSETQPAAVPEPAPMLGFKHAWNATTPEKPILLPSGLLSVSIASGAHFMLAIDKAGALFLSEDRGVSWERINRQWTGHAVEVRRQARDHGASQAAPAAQNPATDGLSPVAGITSPPAGSFELSNDKNETWVSTDGRTWTPK